MCLTGAISKLKLTSNNSHR